MALEYRKLAHVTAEIAAGELTAAALAAAFAADEIRVVNLKGRMLTADEVASHVSGGTDGETVVRP